MLSASDFLFTTMSDAAQGQSECVDSSDPALCSEFCWEKGLEVILVGPWYKQAVRCKDHRTWPKTNDESDVA